MALLAASAVLTWVLVRRRAQHAERLASRAPMRSGGAAPSNEQAEGASPRDYNGRMETEATRALVRQFLDARAANDAATMDTLLADDVVWQPPPSMGIGPFSGRESVVKALSGGAIGKLLDVATMKREVSKLIVEGDTAVAIQRLTGRILKGGQYDNEYCWVYSCRDGKIARLDEYVDSFRAAKLFGIVKS
jgi:ketosteroid isomerase-like protein